MTDLSFMQKKYALQALMDAYIEDIKKLRNVVKTPSDETKLQLYYQAMNTFKKATIKDWVQFALSWGRAKSGIAAQLRDAFPMVMGYRVYHPSEIDVAYAELLLQYAQAFKQYKINLKEWMLRFLLCSQFSPLQIYFERELDQQIANTKQHIINYRNFLGQNTV